MKEILGKKLGMTRIFNEQGDSIPVTVVEAGPCPVVSIRTKEKNGYDAYQVGFGPRKKSTATRPYAGQFKKAGVAPAQYLREVQFDQELEIGSEIKVTAFNAGQYVDVTGTSRGLGFSGTMKRHHFSGGNKTHGQSDRMRAPGSLGQSATPSRVFKGKKMAGRMGNKQVTTLRLQIVDIIEDESLMLIRGPIPGFNGSFVKIRITNRGR